MKLSITFLAVSVCFSSSVYAGTHQLRSGQVYVGDEYVNEYATGNRCYVTIEEVQSNQIRGKHCYSLKMRLGSAESAVTHDELALNSRITNFDRPGFTDMKTCALNTNGSVSGNEIYGEDTSNLYNQIFSGAHQEGWTSYDYFLTLSPETKLPVRSRFHSMGLLSETNVDCVHLEKM